VDREVSNSKRPANGHYSLDKYRSEVKGEPFVLDVSTDETLTIPRPTGDVIFAIEDAMSSKETIEALAGDQAPRLLEIVGGEDAAVMKALSEDMQKHFQLGDS